jgi:stage III sporulation protein AG
MTEKIREFLQQKRWLQLKKTDWIAVALVGVLLLVAAMPSGGYGKYLAESKKKGTAQEKTEQKYEKEDYAEYLEHKLEQVLGQMEGVGKVSVMVTVADQGEEIIEKDKTEHTSTVTNTDSGSMEMTTEKESGEETVYEESGGEKAPYVSKEILPEIEGVLVVAEGGDSPRIVSDISDAVKALFQVEAHRIKVVKMSSKEDGT